MAVATPIKETKPLTIIWGPDHLLKACSTMLRASYPSIEFNLRSTDNALPQYAPDELEASVDAILIDSPRAHEWAKYLPNSKLISFTDGVVEEIEAVHAPLIDALDDTLILVDGRAVERQEAILKASDVVGVTAEAFSALDSKTQEAAFEMAYPAPQPTTVSPKKSRAKGQR